MSSDSCRFQPGDIVRVVRGSSKYWIQPNPVRIKAYWTDGQVVDVEPLHAGEVIVFAGCAPHCFANDCELEVFLTAAHKAVRDA